jgi:hypothetical protein
VEIDRPLADDHVIQAGEGADRVRVGRGSGGVGVNLLLRSRSGSGRALDLAGESGTSTCTSKSGCTERSREQSLLAHCLPPHIDVPQLTPDWRQLDVSKGSAHRQPSRAFHELSGWYGLTGSEWQCPSAGSRPALPPRRRLPQYPPHHLHLRLRSLERNLELDTSSSSTAFRSSTGAASCTIFSTAIATLLR